MSYITYLALLRGINVGGNSIIKMVDLKGVFEKIGFTEVITYIQSGNVIFKVNESNEDSLTLKIESALQKAFNINIPVVIVSKNHLTHVVHQAPKDFGQNTADYRYDVIFIKKPLTPTEAIKSISTNEQVDQVSSGKIVVYFSRLIEKATQSKLSKIVSSPIYKSITIRNWNTTTKLLELMES